MAVLLRLGAMAGRFLALLMLAALLSPADVGLYGLVLAAIAYISYALGLDFYTFSTRELIRSHPGERSRILKAHASLLGLSYAAVLPTALLLFVTALLPWWVAPWFFLLLTLEHLGLEFDRILVAMGDPFGASVAVFLRHGVWPAVVAILFWLQPDTRTLVHVFIVWAICAMLALACAVRLTGRQVWRGSRHRVDWGWVRRGVRLASLLLAGTLMLRVLLTADRYVVAAVADPDVLASYTLFMGLANALTLGVAAAVHQFQYPRLVALAHSGDIDAFHATIRAIALQTVALCMCFVSVSLVLIPSLVDAIDVQAYTQAIWMLPWVLAATVLFNLSMIPHFVLYARDRDAYLTGSATTALLAFAVTLVALPGAIGVLSVLISLVLANFALLTIKALGASMSHPSMRSCSPRE